MKKVHLGCGKNVLKDWINIDIIEAPNVLQHDLSLNLPFEDCSIDFFFSEHFFEHLSKEEGLNHLKEIYRCLKVNGVSRIIVPDLDYLVKSYITNNLLAYKAINFSAWSRCDLINTGMRAWSHKYMYNAEELKLVHNIVGFEKIIFTKYNLSEHPELNNINFRPYCNELSIEGSKK